VRVRAAPKARAKAKEKGAKEKGKREKAKARRAKEKEKAKRARAKVKKTQASSFPTAAYKARSMKALQRSVCSAVRSADMISAPLPMRSAA
jgi:hypothetical protein